MTEAEKERAAVVAWLEREAKALKEMYLFGLTKHPHGITTIRLGSDALLIYRLKAKIQRAEHLKEGR